MWYTTPKCITTTPLIRAAPSRIAFLVSGGISLYEYNVDRAGTYALNADESILTSSALGSGPNNLITPYITKGSARASFKSAGSASYNNEFKYGDIIRANYPLTASITREFMSPNPGARAPALNTINNKIFC